MSLTENFTAETKRDNSNNLQNHYLVSNISIENYSFTNILNNIVYFLI